MGVECLAYLRKARGFLQAQEVMIRPQQFRSSQPSCQCGRGGIRARPEAATAGADVVRYAIRSQLIESRPAGDTATAWLDVEDGDGKNVCSC